MMQTLPLIYISPFDCQGSHNGGWRQAMPEVNGLPEILPLMESLDEAVFMQDKVAVLLEDDLLHPLRIQLEDRVSAKELPAYLKWKLKRYLPYPVERAEMRFLPLAEPNTYLTFSLPTSWVNALFEALAAKGVQCGYIGGLFTTLLENQTLFRDRICLCLYPDFYLLSELDDKGQYLNFRSRRLPYGPGNQLDIQTLIHTDWEPLLRQVSPNRTVMVLNLTTRLDEAYGELLEALPAICPKLEPLLMDGATLRRYQACLNHRAGGS